MKNILVFPCGSEIALEIYRSLSHSTYFHLIGASSVDDHGRFVYEDYIGDIPFVTDSLFCSKIKNIVSQYNIDAIYPATDMAIACLKRIELQLGCIVIAPPVETTEICLSKRKTYTRLGEVIPVPQEYKNIDEIIKYPVFGKHNIGHSAIGTQRLDDKEMTLDYLSHNPDSVICDFLPGEEYTVDCFSNSKRELLFYGVRLRARIKNGISVYTIPVKDENNDFRRLIENINITLDLRGAWFAQFKRDNEGNLVLLEIAARFGGSSALYRAMGVNFAQLTLFDALGYDVVVSHNDYNVEMDRALDNVFKFDISYSEVFVDFDDCLCLDQQIVNTALIAYLYQCRNQNIRITLLTHHDNDIYDSLKKLCIGDIFGRIIQIDRTKRKVDYIDNPDSIFIDDSFAERKSVQEKGIPVFSVDMVPMLLKL